MRMNIFVKTFLMLLISFSVVFLLSIYISYNRFSPMYIEENIEAVKESIIESAPQIRNGVPLEDTSLDDLSSETSFIRYEIDEISDQIGPRQMDDSDVLTMVIDIYDSEDSIVEGNLTYFIEQVDDIYTINYIYEFGLGDYLIINTRIQSLTNVERVLNNINMTQSVALLVTITLLSLLISINISRPIRKISKYAKDISNLEFDSKLKVKRNDEFRDLVSSLNEMTFNLQKSYIELNNANEKLASDIDYEKQQEGKKKQFIYTINHEIKTPLSVIKGMAEGMIEGVGRYKDKEKYLNEIITQIEVIERITQELTYSLRLEDKMKEGDATNILDIISNLENLYELASKKMIQLDIKLEEASLIINSELLDIIIQNLIKNAILYTVDDRVKVYSEKKENSYTITVENKGEIAQKDLEKIFDSFYRSDSSKDNQNGSGLGLYIVKQICDLYKYEYKIYNDNGLVKAKVIIESK